VSATTKPAVDLSKIRCDTATLDVVLTHAEIVKAEPANAKGAEEATEPKLT
jgi:hypothetical protein